MTPYYDDGTCVIYHGDCREVLEWLTADVLVTDPPYGIGWRIGENQSRGHTSKRHDGIVNDEDTTTRDAALGMWGQKPGVVFGSWRAPFPPARQHLVWRKPVDCGVVGSTTGFRTDTELIFLTGSWPKRPPLWSSVLTTDGGKSAYLTDHPHQKPVPLMRTLIERCPEGVVADPFMGSGTTLRAAKDLGRRAIGIEIEERYCEVAARRLAQEVLPL